MKKLLMYAFLFIAALSVYFLFALGMRFFNKTASLVHTFEPEQGITCVQVSSKEGVALSCVVNK